MHFANREMRGGGDLILQGQGLMLHGQGSAVLS